MKLYEQHSEEDLAEAITRTLESASGKKVKNIQIIGDTNAEILANIFFTDNSVLNGFITIEKINGQLAARIRGNYI